MIKSPLVSIITVVYNSEKYLEQTIKSVINQTYNNIEYIIIDGGSTDNTLDIIKENENNISYWVSEQDEGLYDAMNKGICIAKGDLIGMINGDDWYEKYAVETMVNAYLKNPNKSIFHADRYDIDVQGNKQLKKFHSSSCKFKYYAMTYHHPSMFITKNEYLLHNYNIKLRALSDYQFVLETFLKDSDSLYYIEKPIVNYRSDGLSATRTLLDGLKEGYTARKLAGMTMIERSFALLFGMSVSILFSLKNIFLQSLKIK